MPELELQRTEEALTKLLEVRDSATIICYTPFGIVRGKIRRSKDPSATQIGVKPSDTVLKLHNAVVEHYSSHLPTGLHKVFFLRLKEVWGYIVAEEYEGPASGRE
jgi:hypothetical protein